MLNLNQKITGIYAITPNKAPNFVQIQQIFNRHPISILQYRRKISCVKTKLKEAGELQKLCRKNNVLFIINDEIKLAKALKADGVHLGKEDGDIIEARRLLGEDKLIGVSCYNNIKIAINAQKNGASYVAFGAMFPSKTKPNATHCSFEILNQAASILNIPIVGIGGVDFSNQSKLISAGCDSVAMISALFQSTNSAVGNKADI
jgi:thiamine-phosphate pyrophosphorylase